MPNFHSRITKRFRSIIPYTLIISTVLTLYTLCNGFPFSNTNADSAFQTYTMNFFTNEISSNTLNLHYTLDEYEAYGIYDAPISLGSFSTSSWETLVAIENQMHLLSTFNYEDLSLNNQLTYDVIQDYLTTAELGTSYTLFYEPLSPYTGIHTQLPILLAEFPLDSQEDIEIYLALLETLPEYFDSLLAFEAAKSEAGLFMSDTQLNTVLTDCYGFISMEENYLISTFDTRISQISSLTPEEQAALSLNNLSLITDTVLPAYDTLTQGLESLGGTGCNDAGLCYYENGRNYYAYLIRANTGSSRTIPEIQVLIENQILDDLLDLQAAYNTLDEDTFQTIVIEGSFEEILYDLETSMSGLFPTAPDVSITVLEVPEELESFLSPAFYLIPTIDNAYDNTIYMNNAYMTDDLTLYTTLAHEGYPGHLYQNTYFASTNPDPIRSLFSYSGYSEGWATYVEMCSYYFGAISSPEDIILQKNASLNLGLYALVDIGIHYEGWTITDVLSFFKTYGITDSETIIKIYDLIMATPSNYLKYYLGYLELLELKKECIDMWGSEFSQIRFHEAVLEVGPASFDILRKYVLE